MGRCLHVENGQEEETEGWFAAASEIYVHARSVIFYVNYCSRSSGLRQIAQGKEMKYSKVNHCGLFEKHSNILGVSWPWLADEATWW